MKLRPRADLAATRPRCSFCHDETGHLMECSGCSTRIHLECRQEAGKCPTIGCGVVVRPEAFRPEDVPASVRAAFTAVEQRVSDDPGLRAEIDAERLREAIRQRKASFDRARAHEEQEWAAEFQTPPWGCWSYVVVFVCFASGLWAALALV